MSSEPSSDLRLAAIISWHLWCPEARAARETTEAIQNQRIERFRAELVRIFGDSYDIDIKINGGCVEAVIDDLRFLAYEIIIPKTKEIYTAVSVLGRCPSCGVSTMSKPFSNLAGLGKMLEKFEPTHEHYCYTRWRNSSRE